VQAIDVALAASCATLRATPIEIANLPDRKSMIFERRVPAPAPAPVPAAAHVRMEKCSAADMCPHARKLLEISESPEVGVCHHHGVCHPLQRSRRAR